MSTWYDERPQEPEFERDEIDDLKAVLESPAGYRTILRLLIELGAESYCSTSEHSVALRNTAERLLIKAQAASFNNMLKLISDIREHRHGGRSSEQR